MTTTYHNLKKKYHITLFQKHLKGLSVNGGGIERVQINLSKAFLDLGYQVDLVLCGDVQSHVQELSDTMNIFHLHPSLQLKSSLYSFWASPRYLLTKPGTVLFSKLRPRALKYLPSFTSYLNIQRPDIVFSAFTDINLVALLASRLAKGLVPIVVSEHENWREHIQGITGHTKWKWRFPPTELAQLYSEAKGIVAVSHGFAKEVSGITGLDLKKISTIYNPVVSKELIRQSKKEVEHQWFKEKEFPIILGVGRMVPQKNFSLLIRAFARVNKDRLCKLVILGDGKERHHLQQLVHAYDLSNHVDFPGFVDNPYAYMARADIFVLSSDVEPLGNVLIEALACGCPVVSTDCPSGPAEILQHGQYGPLVPVNDEKALAEAILSVLNNPPDSLWLKERSMDFTVDKAAAAYLRIALESMNEQQRQEKRACLH
jgi:glycosyltransferase involved in cell wall biosynthesis